MRRRWLGSRVPERYRSGAYLTLVALSGAAAAWFARGLGGAPAPSIDLPLQGGGVTLSRVGRAGAGTGPAVQAAEGDWLLESDRVRLVVGSDAEGVDRQLGHGVLLDLAEGELGNDAVFGISTTLLIAGREQPLRTLRVEPVVEGERPALRIAQSSRDGYLRLSTFVRLAPGRPWAELTTRAENRGAAPQAAVSIGDRVRWPGAATFAPRLGFVEQATHARVPFIARRGRDLSYALAFAQGADVDFRFDRIGPTEQIATSRAVDIAPGASVEHRRALIVARGGLAAIAEHAFTQAGKKVGRIRGKLSPVPAWATVQAEHGDGRPVLSVRAEPDGSFELPLPADPYRIVLTAPGGEDRQRVTLESGAELSVELTPPEPGTLRFSVVDGRGQPLPARWLVRGIPPTKTPHFGPAERAQGAGSGGYALSGSGRVELPPGRYAFLLTHGIEHAIYEKPVLISRERGETLRAVLPRKVDTPEWIACDFHVHAAPSHDSSVTLEDRVESLVSDGVEFAVATDHNHVTDYAPAVDRLLVDDRLSSVSGIEITTARWGHFNAYPYPTGAPAPRSANADPGEIFGSVRLYAPEALIQVNHPRMNEIGYFNRAGLDAGAGAAASAAYAPDFDVIEVLNGFELGQPEVVEKNIAEWMALLGAGKRYTAVGNSDSHRLGSEWVGHPRTYVRVVDDAPRAVTPREIGEALRAGRAFVTSGPFVIAKADGRGPGELATASDGQVTLQVSVRAPAWIDVSVAEAWLNGRLVASQRATAPPNAPVRLAWQKRIDVEQDAFLIVIVRGERTLDRVLPGVDARPLAFTNPIWIDGDGDGRYGGGDDAGADTADGAPDAGDGGSDDASAD